MSLVRRQRQQRLHFDSALERPGQETRGWSGTLLINESIAWHHCPDDIAVNDMSIV